MEFGERVKSLRIAQGSTLRRFCLEHGFDPGNMSKLERGRLPPPQSRDKLEEYAHALGLEEGSDDWYAFFDLAALSRGEIPPALLSDEEVVAHLPLVFQTLRGGPVTEEQLDRLFEFMKLAL